MIRQTFGSLHLALARPVDSTFAIDATPAEQSVISGGRTSVSESTPRGSNTILQVIFGLAVREKQSEG
jgi:hypothetical protein